MPAAQRRPPAPKGKEALRIDVEVLRHLVSRPSLAKALWSRGPREATQKALHNSYGEEAVLSVKVTQRALSTAVSAINDAFDVHATKLDPVEAPLVVDMVELIISFDVTLDEKLQLMLLIAFLHAALELLPLVRRRNLKATYRRVMDLTRDKAWSSKLTVRIRQIAADTIKDVAAALYRLDDGSHHMQRMKATRRAANNVYKRYSVSDFRPRLHKLALDLRQRHNSWLWVHKMHQLEKRKSRDHSQPNGAASKSRSRQVPDFFSEDEGVRLDAVEMQSTLNENDSVKGGQHAFSPMRTDESEEGSDELLERQNETDSEAVAEIRWKDPPRKKRRSNENEKTHDSSADEGADTPRRSLRPRTLPQGAYVVPDVGDIEGDSNHEEVANAEGTKPEKRQDSDGNDPSYCAPNADDAKPNKRLEDENCEDGALIDAVKSISSDLFDGETQGEAAPLEVPVSRHSRTRRKGKKGDQSGREGSKSPHVVDKEALHGNASGDNGVRGETDSDSDEISRSEVTGRGGETVRKLREANARSRASGIPDPLRDSVRDAKHARRRVRSSLMLQYSGDVNGRAASPIPDSAPIIRRKRKMRQDIDMDASSEEELVTNQEPIGNGRLMRTGRFQIYEDELLVEGLTRYGWGMWRQISDDFGKGKYTRTPMSLKDRARTMNLDPSKYPVPADCGIVKRGRPSLQPKIPVQNRESEAIESPTGSDWVMSLDS
ncbi:unnamed protein product [Chondrus crispus]|uniref:Myb-like domain-containing protein n=1 Tax=Chondrus crispus TaxID=2769 RepID=R7QBA1_CHOCR|nr:unnamed protein product [Chondrus crispus]CDF34745.1 unnamed protein product [Chondrus crispus]|eukprot:XP_005714564.1 unnamed protein product [Chondrus crispus]